MKKVRVIARQNIIAPRTKKRHTDFGLMALDGYFEDVLTVEDDYDRTLLIIELGEKYPKMRGWLFEINEVQP